MMKSEMNPLKILVVTALMILVPFCMQSQLLQVKKATKQSWAAGACCNSGTNYGIQLRITQPKTQIKLDSIWIEGRLYDNLYGTEGAIRMVPDSAGTTVHIQLGYSSGRYGWKNPELIDVAHAFQQRRIMEASDAVIFYRHHGVAHRFSIGRMEELMMIAYP